MREDDIEHLSRRQTVRELFNWTEAAVFEVSCGQAPEPASPMSSSEKKIEIGRRRQQIGNKPHIVVEFFRPIAFASTHIRILAYPDIIPIDAYPLIQFLLLVSHCIEWHCPSGCWSLLLPGHTASVAGCGKRKPKLYTSSGSTIIF
jgi:hypothetical protein